ncbi:similar to Saccharomyces cerevisiae YAR042W SWH1 Protein similar to mammalian oxysterol-binding protein [Maudiozyma saulgeensis]|uniref:Similar to Saccharomyces cerevisiae YAR042W SWH1 Protein similar to mammalian oxysterol-binding protein n=1 Tax=Maudiozyma saulgeensis TaxID=1789683 RepID=A0A1X7RBR8_9SACH|nr:similar to Saccharomyces cerevisiae YAR042W SWH1 Protein similar to mammalian oxysterol-binding protein [Kazachstania saulgeensis]
MVENVATTGKTESKIVSKPLLKLKLLDVLRKGSYEELLQLVKAQFVPVDDTNVIQVTRLILHYAIQVAPFLLIKEIITKNVDPSLDVVPAEKLSLRIDINEQDNNGNTPLHLAAYQSRTDVVSLLMDQPSINDCITNDINLQPFELCRNINVAQLMQYKRSQYIADIATEFRTAFNNRDFQHLESILNNQRNFQLLDINGMDPQTGDTVLHEFVKKRDVMMCRWLLEHGADPFKRDSKGRLPIDLVKNAASSSAVTTSTTDTTSEALTGSGAAGAADVSNVTTQLAIDMELKKMLDKSATEQSVINIDNSNHKPEKLVNNRLTAAPTFKGYLKKWTNFAQGYKLRYFILSGDGKLSYYIDQDDTQNVCRGSLYVSNCYIHLDSSEKLKFEIIGGGTNETIRWHLKGNHPIETNRWVWAIQGAIRYAKDRNKGLVPPPAVPKFNQRGEEAMNLPMKLSVNDHISISADDMNDLASIKTGKTDISSNAAKFDKESQVASTLTSPTGEDLNDLPSSETKLNNKNFEDEVEIDEDEEEEDEDENNRMYDIATNNGVDVQLTYGPYSQKLHFLKRSIAIELSSLGELLGDPSLRENHDSTEEVGEIIETVNKSIYTMNNNFDKLNDLTEKRDKRLINMLRKQYDVNNVWMQSMKELELELIEKDTKLHGLEDERKQLRKVLEQATTSGGIQIDKGNLDKDDNARSPINKDDNAMQQLVELINHRDDDVTADDSDVDEFFDAEEMESANEVEPELERTDDGSAKQLEQPETEIESGTAMEIHDYTKALPVITTAQTEKKDRINGDRSFNGYENGPRTRVKLDSDNRPSVSLWGVLKSMVGKDLTKIALPVSFNEPSSMLQRVSEDYEYGYLLTHASTLADSTLRMLYVAVFTAAPYASTINRVAKPFNPLLGETFEFTDKTQEFRFVTEQVSHHPPICATMGESPRWDFYGESHVDSKFNGRSFNIKHLGKWFVHMRPDDKDSPDEEVYSFMKPDNSVIGILVGKPEVDNVGSARIDNHTTGDYCMLYYKARGWTMAGAYEVRGEIFDKDGKKRWVLGGHWNDSIYAKKCVSSNESDTSSTEFPLDTTAVGTNGTNEPRYDGSKFLVWKANKRQSGVPFNLTRYAIQLNDDNERLLQWTAPTDSRRRPDQRAMEEGRYDDAADEKYRLEEKQRAVRKQREQEDTELPLWTPKWFTRDVHPTTGDSYWHFTGEYWKNRETHSWEACDDIY